MFRSSAIRRGLAVVGISLVAMGCGMNDQVMRWNFKDIGNHPDPMTVLRTSTDGDERAKAMYGLKEPKRNGGNDAVQDEAIQILTDAAINDPRALCRIAGVSALGRFEDPRATKVILVAYYGSSAFTSDQANAVRLAAMTALGHKKSPDALSLVARAAAAPAAPVQSAKSDVHLASLKEEDTIEKLLSQ